MFGRVLAIVASTLLASSVLAAPASKRNFNLPADDAVTSLKLFAEQSGQEIIYPPDVVKGTLTKEVNGEFTPREAIDRMLVGTKLVVTESRSGLLTVNRAPDPKSQVAAPTADDRPVPTAKSDATGELRGRVSNAVTHQNLENAHITLVGLERSFLSERDGTFDTGRLPAGSYTVMVDYPGLDSFEQTVTVGNGQIARLEIALNSSVYILPEFSVAGQREGNAAAIAEQHLAPNLKNSITADAFGEITKANIGNLLRRIPGVTGITDDEIDTSVIQVRGMDAALTSIDIDGTRAASANNGSRKQNVNAIPADIIEKVEVVKAPTAEDDADSLGGRVKLTTKSALDLNQRLIDLRLGASYNMTYATHVTEDHAGYVPPSAGLTYADVLDTFGGQKNLGVFLNGNYDRFLDARSVTSFNHVSPSGGSPSATQKDYSAFNLTSDELHEQERKGGGVRLDFKVDERTRVGVSGAFTRYLDNFTRSRNMITNGAVNTALSDPDPLYTVITNSAYSATRNLRLSDTDTWNIRLFGSTLWHGAKITGDVNFQQADKFEFRNQTQFTSNRKFTYALDRRDDGAYPKIVVLSGLDPFTDRFTDTASTALEVRRQAVDKDIWASHVDVSKPLDWHWPVTIQTGLRFRDEAQLEDQDRFVATVAPGVGKDLSSLLDTDWKNGGAVGRYPVGAVPSNDKVLGNHVKWVGGSDPRTAWQYDPNFLTMNASSTVQNSLLSDSNIDEAVYAAYLQGSVKTGNLLTLAGVRVERTEVHIRAGVRNRAVTDLLAQFNGEAKSTSSYNDVFPTLHLRYRLSDQLQLRASVSTTIGRPDKGTVTTNDDINLSSRTITTNNPDVKPEYSTNYDASAEYYFKPLGVLSVGVFQKNIRDYISSVSSTISAVQAADLGAPLTNPSASDPAWTLTTNNNSGSARVTGLEFNYSQQLSFLPGALRGLGVFLNYTTIHCPGVFQTAGGVTSITPLLNFVPRSGNCGLSYTYGRWDARVQANYQSSFEDGYNASDPAQRNSFKGKRLQGDFNVKCRVTKRLSVFANVSNFTTENLADYEGSTAASRRDETDSYSFIVTGGIDATF